jgi:hypothetical protein
VTRFSIFKKSSGFYWSNNKIACAIICPPIIIVLFRLKVLNLEENEIDKYLSFLMLGGFILGLILKFSRLTKPDPLRGKLEGFITFGMNEIIADQEIIKLDEIQKLIISNNDYYGKYTGSSRTFNSNLSNGVDNYIEITLNAGGKKTFYFELYNSNGLQKTREELINYNLKGKLHFLNLIEVLGIEKYEEIQDFKKEIQNLALPPTAAQKNC